ncbi:MAG TPA: nuclear transport factor 2 family protein [Chthonomonadaceae bacterium]|nr:nuclear transport factor 2 family protein [Chthonomonadaceae bacterium]
MLVRRPVPIAMTLYAALALAPLATADATADARKAIQTAYNQANAAMARKDVNGGLAHFAPDFEAVTRNGKKIMLPQIRQQLQQITMMQSIRAKSTIQKFRLKGNQAVVTVKEHADLTGVNPQNKQKLTMSIDSVSEDTWVKSGKGWLQKRSKSLRETAKINGKPIPGGM